MVVYSWKTVENYFKKILDKFKFYEIWSIENYFQSIKWNNDQSIWFDWYSIAS